MENPIRGSFPEISFGNCSIPLTPFGSGMTAPVFALHSPANGSVTLLPGGTAARFTPAASFTGGAHFSFTVSGHGVIVPMTMAVLVTNTTTVPPPEVSFQDIQISGGSLSCSVNSQPGFLYQLQSSETMAEGTWINSGSAKAGNGNPVTFTDTTAGAAGRKFYLVAAFLP